MRKILLAVLVTACLGAIPAGATTMSVFGAGWDPNALDDALGAGLGVNFPFGDGPLSLDVRTTYYRSANLDNVGDDDREVFGKLQIVPVDAALRYEFNNDGPSTFYVGGGASYYFLSLSDSDFDINDEVGLLGLVGARFGSFFIEGSYRNAKGTVKRDDIANGVRRSVALALDGPAVNAGWTWSF
jgi:hypothetical protein